MGSCSGERWSYGRELLEGVARRRGSLTWVGGGGWSEKMLSCGSREGGAVQSRGVHVGRAAARRRFGHVGGPVWRRGGHTDVGFECAKRKGF